MPRPLVFGNGNVLVGIDDRYCIRDLFYPRVGLHNHLSGHRIGFGVWVDGRFAWTEADGWERSLGYRRDTLVGDTSLKHDGLGVSLRCVEAVLPRSDDFLRRIEVRNRSTQRAEIRLFFTHDLRINESDIGDTAFYNPFLDGVIHYKGPVYILFGGTTSKAGLFQYATGIKGFGGLEGTWRDAEDGALSMNPIAQGSVDSTLSLRLELDPGQSAIAYYWVLCATNLEGVATSHRRLLEVGLDAALDDAERYWRAYSARPRARLRGMREELVELATRSLLTIRTQTDNGGAILAANDSDIMKTNRANYSFVWPRDGAFVSTVYDGLGFHQPARRFFEFCLKTLPHDRPVWLQKYMADGSLGASWHPWIVDGKPETPFQEDETALTLHALWRHFDSCGDLEFLDDLFEPMVLPTASFLERYRDPGTHLPLPSYDLWEERRGVHTFTVASVVAGLRAAAQICRAVGSNHAARFEAAAAETHEALHRCLYDDERGVFLRRLAEDEGGRLVPDPTIDSAVLSVLLLGCVDPASDIARRTIETVRERLWVNTPVGGLARYDGDYYFRVLGDQPGNPWIICTLWLAQALCLTASQPEDLEEPLRLLEWTIERSRPTGILPEQVHPLTGEPLSVSPLTWSHAEAIATVLAYSEKARSWAD